MSIIIDAITHNVAFTDLPINPVALVAILMLIFLLGWKEKLRTESVNAHKEQMILFDIVIFPLGCVFAVTILLRVMTFF